MAGQGQLASASEGEAVHRGDHGLRKGFDPLVDRLAAQGLHPGPGGVESLQLRDVGPRHEGLFAGPGEHHDAHLGVVLKLGEELLQLLQHLVVQGVEFLRPVEGDPGDAVGFFDEDERHGGSLFGMIVG